MSCDYHVYCRSCSEQHPFMDANHGDRLMHHLIRHAAAIAALVPLIHESPESIDFRVFYGHIDPSWFARHLGHDLCVRDEYGKIDGTCGKRFDCPGCNTPHYCCRPMGHPDACSSLGGER